MKIINEDLINKERQNFHKDWCDFIKDLGGYIVKSVSTPEGQVIGIDCEFHYKNWDKKKDLFKKYCEQTKCKYYIYQEPDIVDNEYYYRISIRYPFKINF